MRGWRGRGGKGGDAEIDCRKLLPPTSRPPSLIIGDLRNLLDPQQSIRDEVALSHCGQFCAVSPHPVTVRIAEGPGKNYKTAAADPFAWRKGAHLFSSRKVEVRGNCEVSGGIEASEDGGALKYKTVGAAKY